LPSPCFAIVLSSSFFSLCQLKLYQIAWVHIAQVGFSYLPNCKVGIAQFSIKHHHVWILNSILLFCQISILSDCQVQFCLWTAQNKLQAVHKLIVFGDVQGLNFVFGLLKCLPQKIRLALVFLLFFFHRLPPRVPSLFPSFSLSSLFFYLIGLCSFTLSKFKLPLKLFFEYFESKLKGFDFKFQVFFIIQSHEWCRFEAILVGWNSIYENSWNFTMKYRNTIYNLFFFNLYCLVRL
jgi:hypothetical protein